MTTTNPTAETNTAPAGSFDRGPVWKRGGYMLIFLVAFYLAQGFIALSAIVQFVTLMLTGKPNAFVADFGRSFAIWVAEVTAFQTGATENRPFPFAPWPKAD